MEAVKVSVNDLVKIIGDQTVEIRILRETLGSLTNECAALKTALQDMVMKEEKKNLLPFPSDEAVNNG